MTSLFLSSLVAVTVRWSYSAQKWRVWSSVGRKADQNEKWKKRTSIFRCSLLVHVLCKLNRLTEALDLLEGVVNEAESDDRPQVATKIAFPVETVMTLTKAVEATKDKVRFFKSAFWSTLPTLSWRHSSLSLSLARSLCLSLSLWRYFDFERKFQDNRLLDFSLLQTRHF